MPAAQFYFLFHGTIGDWEQEILRLEDFDNFPTTFLCDQYFNSSKFASNLRTPRARFFPQWHRVFCLLLLEL